MIKENPSKKIYVEIIKILVIIMIPLIFIEVIIYFNLSQNNFSYFYDVGNSEDNSLSPIARISDKVNDSGLTYVNLTDQLVYFDIPTVEGTDKINLEIRFKDNFPNNTNLLLGAKNSDNWSYKYKTIYDKTIEELLEKYPYQTKDNLILIKLNPHAKEYDLSELNETFSDIKLATNLNISTSKFKIDNYSSSKFEIDTALRGSLTFYVYVKGDLNVKVWKRDLNWYNKSDKGEDILNISLYTLDNKLISYTLIEDDGERGKSPNKNNTEDQSATLITRGLNEGVYKLELKNNEDLLITKLQLNQNKIVVKGPILLAESNAYFNDLDSESNLFFKVRKSILVYAQIWHNEGIQIIKINDYRIKLEEKNEKGGISLDYLEGFYKIRSSKNDVKISGPSLFAFTEDSWFDPFESEKLYYKTNITYLENNADYVLVNYSSPKEENGWKIASLSFNIKEDDLYINDDKLNILFNAAHLNQNKNNTNTYYIPIDWINITVHKRGILG
ncbi:hypothetical protein M0R72_04800 [Candidatus Pacearchaeota archaeon]|jgi:hypothetical protein|nr:hypothetical protein [Candidatus Pacearchaeota archaeon]